MDSTPSKCLKGRAPRPETRERVSWKRGLGPFGRAGFPEVWPRRSRRSRLGASVLGADAPGATCPAHAAGGSTGRASPSRRQRPEPAQKPPGGPRSSGSVPSVRAVSVCSIPGFRVRWPLPGCPAGPAPGRGASFLFPVKAEPLLGFALSPGIEDIDLKGKRIVRTFPGTGQSGTGSGAWPGEGCGGSRPGAGRIRYLKSGRLF